MIVIDCSAALSALLGDGQARDALRSQSVHAPHLIDTEVASALRTQVAEKILSPRIGLEALISWGRVPVARHSALRLAERVWQLKENLSAYDATYVALAEALGCGLVTCDGRSSRAPGIACPVTVLPN